MCRALVEHAPLDGLRDGLQVDVLGQFRLDGVALTGLHGG